MRAWGKLKRLCALGDFKTFSLFPPFGAIRGKNCILKRATHLQFRTKGENWDGTDFNMGDGTRCSEYSEFTLILKFKNICLCTLFLL